MLNLWLHKQKPHYRSHRAGTRNMMLTFDSRPIYRALTYIAVPFLGPQQPRYIGLTLYLYLNSYSIVSLTCGWLSWVDMKARHILSVVWAHITSTGNTIGNMSANGKQCHNATSSLIGWVRTQNGP